VLHRRASWWACTSTGSRGRSPPPSASPADYIEALTPPPTCDVSVGEAHQLWPEKALWINFPSSVHVEPLETVRQTARRILEEAVRTGGSSWESRRTFLRTDGRRIFVSSWMKSTGTAWMIDPPDADAGLLDGDRKRALSADAGAADDLTGALEAGLCARRWDSGSMWWRPGWTRAMPLPGFRSSWPTPRRATRRPPRRQKGGVPGRWARGTGAPAVQEDGFHAPGNIPANWAPWCAFTRRRTSLSFGLSELGRTVREGILFVHGKPVHETAFADDR